MAVRNASAVPRQTAAQSLEQLIVLDAGSDYPVFISTPNGSTMVFAVMKIDTKIIRAGLSAHTYHAAAVPEEL